MKRIFSVFLCLTVWLSAFGYDFVVDGFAYDTLGNGQVEVFIYGDDYSGIITIPSTVTNNSVVYSVTSIGVSAFYRCSSLTSVTIPNSVTSIGEYAFSNCSGLTSVTIPNSVTSIGKYAFAYCRSLTSVTIPNSVTSIGNYAFYDCSGLTSITIPKSAMPISPYFGGYATEVTINDGVDSIPDYAFQSCRSLMSITIPNSVTYIGEYAFQDCIGLTSITIPNSVTSIGNAVFYGCEGLASVTVDAGNAHYDSRNNSNAIIETATNTLIVGCNNTVIPNSVTSIGEYAFFGCSGLTSITIPDSVTSIGEYAFFGCSGLTSIVIPNGVTSIRDCTFAGCTGLTSITIPNSVMSIGSYAFLQCDYLLDITCYATTPPAIESSTFSNYDATLYVPSGAVSDYSSAIYWRNFYIQAISGPSAMQYTLEDQGVYYLGGKVYNSQNLYIKLYYSDGKLLSSGTNDIEMSSCPNGIYIVTDGKGGFLKINHYR